MRELQAKWDGYMADFMSLNRTAAAPHRAPASTAPSPSCPALSLPVGHTASGLPVGLQVIGPCRAEGSLLRACHRMEEVFALAAGMPIDPH